MTLTLLSPFHLYPTQRICSYSMTWMMLVSQTFPKKYPLAGEVSKSKHKIRGDLFFTILQFLLLVHYSLQIEHRSREMVVIRLVVDPIVFLCKVFLEMAHE